MSQPTAGAMRAAIEIDNLTDWGSDEVSLAKLIDAETGLPELLEAARNALHIIEIQWPASIGDHAPADALRAGIAKCKGAG